jgi:hypothetical protein
MRHISIPEPVMKPDGYYDDAQARSRLQGVIDAFWKGVGGGGGVGGGSPPPPHVPNGRWQWNPALMRRSAASTPARC